MRTQTVSLSAVGVTPWLPLNYRQSPFNASIAVDFDSLGAMTYTVEHTFDDFGAFIQYVQLSQVGTTVTATFPTSHDLNTGDTLVVNGSGNPGQDGQFIVTSTGLNTLTYVNAISQTSTSQSTVLVARIRPFPKTAMTAKITIAEDLYLAPVTAVRLNVTAWTAGKATLIVNQGANR
jgi:hypothetical protein